MNADAGATGAVVGVRRATPAELDPVLGMLADVGQWLLSKGIRQWIKPPPSRFMLKAIERGEVYIATCDGEPCGTFTLSWSDTLWKDRGGEAGYLHRLAIRRPFGGRGLGLCLLRQAEQMTAAAGKEYLRLDCWSENLALCSYYERAGYTRRGQASWRDYSCCLFEKRVR